MKMKKILAGTVSAVMIISGAAVTAEEISNDVAVIMPAYTYDKVNMNGEVKEISDGQIMLGEENNTFVINVDENTLFIDADGNKISIGDIKEGENLAVWSDVAQTRSVPPQSYAYAVGKFDGESIPTFAEVTDISKDDKGNTVLSSADGQYEIVVGDSAKGNENIDKIKKGTYIAAYSKLMTMSIPAVIPAEKIAVIGQGKEKVTVFDKLTVNGKEISAEIKTDGTNLLPARAVCEALGLDVEWDNEKKAITVGTLQMGVNFRIGENKYAKAKMMPFVLSAAPQLINDKTYVPEDFFTDVIGAELTVEKGQINIKD